MTYETQKNTIEFKVYAKNALFTDPITKIGGEKCSYQIPTYEAIKGICKSIYWKPTFIWIVDEVKVINKIEMESKGMRPIKYDGGNELSFYTYLKNVEYFVRAHFEWNNFRIDLQQDQNSGKHFEIANRALAKGGRQDIFLGTRECQGYVQPCTFNERKSEYDDVKELVFGNMFHSFSYPNENGTNKLKKYFWNAKMQRGIINFPQHNNIKQITDVREISTDKRYIFDTNFLCVHQEYENIIDKEN
ncbi:MAG: type I-C CRISPR-associated protein Cas5c [Endomicrobium sp.]|jgi:CRISPR-associated protein Cas5d|nr:type I-C CRISPR-associated protein Cas5c [Endomicrobium sp.]